jgi:hypothetical protein
VGEGQQDGSRRRTKPPQQRAFRRNQRAPTLARDPQRQMIGTLTAMWRTHHPRQQLNACLDRHPCPDVRWAISPPATPPATKITAATSDQCSKHVGGRDNRGELLAELAIA